MGSLNLLALTGRRLVCVTSRSDGARAYVSLFGPAGGIAVVDVPTMAWLGRGRRQVPFQGAGSRASNDGRTIILNSAGGMGHFYRLDTVTDTLTDDTG